MRAVILAAGSGRRMRPLSDATPKPLLVVDGRPLVTWTIDALIAAGVESVLVVTGHRAPEVESELRGRYPDLDLRYVRNERYADTNTLGSLLVAFDHEPPGGPMIVAEADVICNESIIRELVEAEDRDASIVSAYGSASDGTAVAVSDGVITEFVLGMPGRTSSLETMFKTVNIHRLTADTCRRVIDISSTGGPGLGDDAYYEAALSKLCAAEQLRIRAQVIAPTDWIEVDDPSDLRVARFRFERGRRTHMVDRAKGGLWRFDLVDFAHMSNQRFPPERFDALLTRQLADLSSAYGSSQDVLDEKLGLVAGCRPDRLLCVNGVSQLFPILERLCDGRPVIIPSPTFGEYERLTSAPIRYADQVGWDIEDVERVVTDDAAVVFVNPNNPTGTTRPPQTILEFAAAHPAQLVIVDESFIDFTPHPSMIDLLEEHRLDNVLVLRSLGKAIGLAGVRLGLAYTTDPALRAAIAAQLPIWNINSIAECVLDLLPRFHDELQRSFAETVVDRDAFAEELSGSASVDRVHPSGGNFLLVDLADHAQSAAEVRKWLLEEHDLLVKDVTDRFGSSTQRLRLAVRRPEENRRLVECLVECLADLSQTRTSGAT